MHEEPGTAEYSPAGQSSQAVLSALVFWPALQGVHIFAPLVAAMVPSGHSMHSGEPGAEYFPLEHMSQPLLSPLDFSPAPQGVHSPEPAAE